MLDLSRIDAGLPLELHDVDVAAVLRDEADRAALLAPQIGVRRTGLTALNVRADATRLSQIVSNLLDNARRYTPPGGAIEIDLRAGDGAAEITVTDTGPGIPDDERERIFDRLVRPATTAAPGWAWPSAGPRARRRPGVPAASGRCPVPAHIAGATTQ